MMERPTAQPQLLLAAPWPPTKSDIARHVAEILLPAMQQHYPVALIGSQDGQENCQFHGCEVMPVESGLSAFPVLPLVAHVGNETRQNDAALAALARRPGIVVMHDIVLHHAWYDACIRADRFDDYLASVSKYGGALLAEQAKLARHHSAVVHRIARRLPLFEPFLENAQGVVVHSRMAFDAVSVRGLWPVCLLGLPTPMPNDPAAVLAHRRAQVLELQSGAPLRLILFGYLGPNRCLTQIIDAMAILKAKDVPVRLDIYGQLADPAATQEAIERANLSTHVALHGFVSNAELDQALQQAHLACNFRAPTMGEASGSQLRLYAAGLPALMVRTGWYAEQPESAVLHVQPGSETAGMVAAAMRLLRTPGELPVMAAAGLAHLQQHHDPAAYVQRLARFVSECGRTGPPHRLARQYVALAAKANAALQLPDTVRMGRALADLSGLDAQAINLRTELGRASRLASPSHPSIAGAPNHHTSMSITYPASGQPPSPELAQLARRAQTRTELPAKLQGSLLEKLGLAPVLLKLWNFISRDWRGPIELTHRILARHDPVIADMQRTQSQLAQFQQQILMVRADLIAAEDQITALSERLQQRPTEPGAGDASLSVASRALERDFMATVSEHFRGDAALLAQRLSIHLPQIEEALARCNSGLSASQYPTIIDLGCGRGDWLALLQQAGHPAQGVDLSPDCVLACQARALDVRLGDALRELAHLPSDSLAVVTAFHLVEHLPLAGQITLFNEACRVLAPGGLLVVETPNPENLGVISRNFWYDPTHQRPVPRAMLHLLAKAAGFTNMTTQLLQEPPQPADEAEAYTPRLRHMLFCGEDAVVYAIK